MNNNIVNIVLKSIYNNGGVVALRNDFAGAMKDTRSLSVELKKLGGIAGGVGKNFINLGAEIIKGSIWGAIGQGIAFVCRKLGEMSEAAEKAAKKAEEAQREAFKKAVDAVNGYRDAAEKAFKSVNDSIDVGVKKIYAEIDATKELVKAELELERARAKSRGDFAAVKEIDSRLASVDKNADKEKTQASVAAVDRKIAEAQKERERLEKAIKGTEKQRGIAADRMETMLKRAVQAAFKDFKLNTFEKPFEKGIRARRKADAEAEVKASKPYARLTAVDQGLADLEKRDRAALEKVVASIDALKAERSNLDKHLQTIRTKEKTEDEQQYSAARLEKRLAEVRREHEARIAAIEKERAARIAEIEARAPEADLAAAQRNQGIEAINAQAVKDVEAVETAYKELVAAIKGEEVSYDPTASLKQEIEARRRARQEEMAARLKDVEAELAAKIAAIEKEHALNLAAIKAEGAAREKAAGEVYAQTLREINAAKRAAEEKRRAVRGESVSPADKALARIHEEHEERKRNIDKETELRVAALKKEREAAEKNGKARLAAIDAEIARLEPIARAAEDAAARARGVRFGDFSRAEERDRRAQDQERKFADKERRRAQDELDRLGGQRGKWGRNDLRDKRIEELRKFLDLTDPRGPKAVRELEQRRKDREAAEKKLQDDVAKIRQSLEEATKI